MNEHVSFLLDAYVISVIVYFALLAIVFLSGKMNTSAKYMRRRVLVGIVPVVNVLLFAVILHAFGRLLWSGREALKSRRHIEKMGG